MTWIILLGYFASVVIAPVPLTRAVYVMDVKAERCHGENSQRHKWSGRGHCREFCKRGCWRDDSGRPIDGTDAGWGSAAAHIWPVALFGLVPLFALRVNQRMVRPSLVSVEDIARMERELGIEADR